MACGDVVELGEWVRALIPKYGSDPLRLLQILREVQDRYAWISPEAVQVIARELGVRPGLVTATIEFYAFLHDTPRGRYDILISDSITDHMLGSRRLLEQLCQRLGVVPGATRDDRLVSVDTTSCTGMCDQGPAGLVNGFALTRLDRGRMNRIAELVEREAPLAAWPPELFQVEDNVCRRDLLLTGTDTPGEALGAVAARGADAVLDALDASGLRGMGGAGFRTAAKWRACRDTPADQRYVVCNADEGEPGTFKDRVLLGGHVDLLLEGMTLCARLVHARKGYIYLRGEYRYLLPHLEAAVARRREAGLLGRGIRGAGAEPFDFDLELHLGAGAYVCGEESALIESLEGKRGVARIRPPFPVTQGFLNKPTVVNNVETFAAAARIAVHGSDWWRGAGTGTSPGTKLLSISGDCDRPGVYEYPFGVTVAEVLADCGAGEVQAVQVAGAAGHTIGPHELDRRIAFEDLPTGGSFMVFGPSRDLLDMVRNFTAFFAHESCGFCTPCRVGTPLLRDLVEKVARGHATDGDLEELRTIGGTMRAMSQCGLGKTAPNAAFDVLEKFPAAYRRRLSPGAFQPGFDLDAALSEARCLTGRDDPEAHL